MTRLIRLAVSLALLSAFSSFAAAQRLPETVRPTHYQLSFTPDLQNATFRGAETIDVQLLQPSDTVTLNAADLKFDKVTVAANGKTMPAEVSLDPAKQMATIKAPQQLAAGPARLSIDFTGVLNDKLRGFYLSKARGRNYAVTQFEPTDARRAFPSFDEPAMKATFDITLVVPKGDTAISNMPVASDTPGPEPDKHTVHFQTTPKMSTYLVAMLVGDFQCVSGRSDGTPIRACATPDKVQMGRYAVGAAEFVLHYYNTYFGIRYPLPKLDMIALPDFEAGAMENFGAITYRETALLIDEKTAPLAAKKEVGLVVAHEMAHQWFGDLVTMSWWNNLWLNEGFATWMETKPLAAWHPDWEIHQDETLDAVRTLELDSLGATRAIRAKADTPAEINAMFDGITYGKAGSVLRMVEAWIGPEVFRKGVHNYLEAHLYANATAEDFWNAQTRTSGRPVDRVMDSYVSLPGVPLVTADYKCSGGKGTVALDQRRFVLGPASNAQGGETWTIHVCYATGDVTRCELVSRTDQTLNVPACGPWLYANGNARGYYHSEHDQPDFDRLAQHIEDGLTPDDRILLLADTWALVRDSKRNIGSYLQLVSGLQRDRDRAVMEDPLRTLRTIGFSLVPGNEQPAYRRWLVSLLGPAWRQLRDAPADASGEQMELRADLLETLARAGDDPQAIADARSFANRYLDDPASVNAALGGRALLVAAIHGDAALFDRIWNAAQHAATPDQYSQYMDALTSFAEPALTDRALQLLVSGKVRNQDSGRYIARMVRFPETSATAWNFVRNHWNEVQAQTTVASGPRIVEASGYFCSAEQRDQVRQFFADHPIEAAARALHQAIDRIDVCINVKQQQEQPLAQWLSQHETTATASR